MALMAEGSTRDETVTTTLGCSDSGDGPVGTGELESAMDTLTRFVSDFDPARYSGEDASVLVGWFTRCERLAATGKTLAASRAAAAHRPEAGGHPTPAHWLSAVTGESIGESADVLRMGAAFSDQSGVEEACRQGRLSRQAARMVTDAVRANPASEDDLVDAAQTDTMRQLRDRCLRAKAEARSAQDAATAYKAIHDSRHCRTWTDRDGAFRLDARLTPDAGASLLEVLAGEADAVFRRAKRAGQRESPDAYRADALVALVTGRGVIGRPGTKKETFPTDNTASDDPETDGLTTEDTTRAPDPRAVVTLRVDLDALRRGSIGPGEICEIPGVGPVPVETARELMGDSITRLVITNGVDVTTVCHLGRSIPARLRTAVEDRDRVCVVPGCDTASGLEIDHWGIDFNDGGPASLENVARLCHHHHLLRTHKGFQLLGGPGRWRWIAPERSKGHTATESPPDDEPPDPDDPPLFTFEE
jgi:hypothetical protein